MPKRPTGKRRPVSGGAPVAPAGEDLELHGGTSHQPAESAEAERIVEEAAQAEAAAADLADAAREVRDDPAAKAGRREGWRRRSATGAILTGFALGLQEVFEPEKKEPAIVMETSGDPPRDLPVEAELEMATSRRSVVRIRPWLLEDGTPLPLPADDELGAPDRPDPEDGA